MFKYLQKVTIGNQIELEYITLHWNILLFIEIYTPYTQSKGPISWSKVLIVIKCTNTLRQLDFLNDIGKQQTLQTSDLLMTDIKSSWLYCLVKVALLLIFNSFDVKWKFSLPRSKYILYSYVAHVVHEVDKPARHMLLGMVDCGHSLVRKHWMLWDVRISLHFGKLCRVLYRDCQLHNLYGRHCSCRSICVVDTTLSINLWCICCCKRLI